MEKKYKYHTDADYPPEDHVFCFGSNMAGIHGAGAAKFAKMYRGAKQGAPLGHVGNSYAIPTKNHMIKTISLDQIKKFVTPFLAYAAARPDLTFWVTRIGCGLAGYTNQDIAPLFKGAPTNCNFEESWAEYLE